MAKKIKYDHDRRRKYGVLMKISAVGKSKILISCPFCWCEFWAYIWSLCGGGKKCHKCGARHNGFGQAVPVIEVNK